MSTSPSTTSRHKAIRTIVITSLPLLALLALYVTSIRREAWRKEQRDNIYEAVFRHEMQRLDKELSPRPARYYLALRLSDPGDRLMRRFRDLGPRVENYAVARKVCGSALTVRNDVIEDQAAGERAWERMQQQPEHAGVLISLDLGDVGEGPMRWYRHSTLACLAGILGQKEWMDDWRYYTVEWRDGTWVVTRNDVLG